MCFSYITGWWFGTCLLFFHDISIISHMIIKKIVFNHVFLIYYWLVVWNMPFIFPWHIYHIPYDHQKNMMCFSYITGWSKKSCLTMCFSYITGWWFGTCLLFFHDISIISHMIIKKIVFNHVFLIYYWLVVWNMPFIFPWHIYHIPYDHQKNVFNHVFLIYYWLVVWNMPFIFPWHIYHIPYDHQKNRV